MRRYENRLRERLIEDGFNPDDPSTVRILVAVKKLEQERKRLGLADCSMLGADEPGYAHQSAQLWAGYRRGEKGGHARRLGKVAATDRFDERELRTGRAPAN